MYDANTHYLLMQRKQRRRQEYADFKTHGSSDNRASQRIMPGLSEKYTTRMDRILKPYRGRSYEGPTEPEVV